MPHVHSRQAFNAIASNVALPQFSRLYATLVTLELMLKDAALAGGGGPWSKGHDVPALLTQFDAGLAILATNLGNAIGALFCTDLNGNCAPVPGGNFPHMRYLRHTIDHPAPATSDADIHAALNLAIQCVQQLNQSGLNP